MLGRSRQDKGMFCIYVNEWVYICQWDGSGMPARDAHAIGKGGLQAGRQAGRRKDKGPRTSLKECSATDKQS